MLKKLFVIILAAVMLFTLSGCSILRTKYKLFRSNNNACSSSETAENKKSNADSNGTDQSQDKIPKNDNVVSKVKLYEGNYFDNKRYGENRPNPYIEIAVSNVTDTSFDFAIYEVDENNSANKRLIFNNNTAEFINDGMTAAFYGKEYTLFFTFPDNHKSYPAATDMEITGFEPLDGKTFVNNSIPGHEFGLYNYHSLI